jgi:CMP-N-acetylneuraminic acid synthetase
MPRKPDYSKVLVVVPCKLDSKRLPEKNFCKVGDYSLVSLAIRAANHALPGSIVLVVWQSPKPAPDFSKEAGARCHLTFAPPWLSSESSAVVAMYATLMCINKPEIVVLLQPSSVRRPALVAEAVRRIVKTTANAVASVQEVRHAVGSAKQFQFNGGVYAWETEFLLEWCFKPLCFSYFLDGEGDLGTNGKVVDIDTEADLAVARIEFGQDGGDNE